MVIEMGMNDRVKMMETDIGRWAKELTGAGANRLRRKGLIKEVGF